MNSNKLNESKLVEEKESTSADVACSNNSDNQDEEEGLWIYQSRQIISTGVKLKVITRIKKLGENSELGFRT